MFAWGTRVWGDDGTRLVERVVAAINDRDFDALGGLVTPDVRFIDSMGEGVSGQELAFEMLGRLVAFDPALLIHIDDLTTHGDAVLLTGRTTGSRDMTSQRTLWKLMLRDGLVSEWRSYSADNPRPVIRMLMGTAASTTA